MLNENNPSQPSMNDTEPYKHWLFPNLTSLMNNDHHKCINKPLGKCGFNYILYSEPFSLKVRYQLLHLQQFKAYMSVITPQTD